MKRVRVFIDTGRRFLGTYCQEILSREYFSFSKDSQSFIEAALDFNFNEERIPAGGELIIKMNLFREAEVFLVFCHIPYGEEKYKSPDFLGRGHKKIGNLLKADIDSKGLHEKLERMIATHA